MLDAMIWNAHSYCCLSAVPISGLGKQCIVKQHDVEFAFGNFTRHAADRAILAYIKGLRVSFIA